MVKLEELALKWQNLANDFLVPGLAIAVLNKEKPVWSMGFGLAKNSVPVTANTIFEAASLSKLVVAFATLKLCETGLLELDRPLTNYVPDPDLEHDARLGLITVRQVLSHTSGLPNWVSEDEIAVTNFEPGERFSYSGIGFRKLQTVIEKITVVPLEEHLQETIFKPFKMYNSSFIWQEHLSPSVAFGHDEHGLVVHKDQPPRAFAAYSMHSTVLDLGRFVENFLQSKISLELLRPQVALNNAVFWGLGWGLETCTSGTFFWQWGSNPGFRSLIFGAKNSEFAVVVLTNGANGNKLWKPILNDLTGIQHPALAWLEGN